MISEIKAGEASSKAKELPGLRETSVLLGDDCYTSIESLSWTNSNSPKSSNGCESDPWEAQSPCSPQDCPALQRLREWLHKAQAGQKERYEEKKRLHVETSAKSKQLEDFNFLEKRGVANRSLLKGMTKTIFPWTSFGKKSNKKSKK